MNLFVKKIEEKYTKRNISSFEIGDTVKVHTKIIEGDKERVQVYTGLVVGMHGMGPSATFTVSRTSFGYANEKIFPVCSPNLSQIEVIRKGKVRKSKLHYLRGKLGKAAKVEGVYNQQAKEEVATEE
jgi:large subunit ribosomal protein L19